MLGYAACEHRARRKTLKDALGARHLAVRRRENSEVNARENEALRQDPTVREGDTHTKRLRRDVSQLSL